MSRIKFVSDAEVGDQVDMTTAISLMREAFIQISKRTANIPIRVGLEDENKLGRVLFMPAYSPGFHLFGLKMVSVFPDNVKRNIPSIQGKMLIMDDKTGTPLGLIDAEYLTALRTGAASGLATDLLALPEAKVLAIFGTGTQSKTQVKAILEVRKIEKILVFGNSTEKSNHFCQFLKKEYQIEIIPGHLESLNEADVICTATTSTNPLFKLENLKPGVHINGIGSYKPTIREIPSEVIKRSLLVVDHWESALVEAGDIIIPIEDGLVKASHIHAELGEIITGRKEGRKSNEQITVFKSVGNAVQDLAMASYLLK